YADNEFSSGRIFFEMLSQFRKRTPDGLFKLLADFTGNRSTSVLLKIALQLFQRFHQAVGRLIEDHCSFFSRQALNTGLSSFFLREKTLKGKTVSSKTRIDQGRDKSRGTRQGLHNDMGGNGLP